MAVRKQPISFISIPEQIGEFKIDDKHLIELSRSLGQTISEDAKEELEVHCLTYLREKQAANLTKHWKEVEAHFVSYQKAEKALKMLANELSLQNDASFVLRRIINAESDGGMLTVPIRQPRSDLVTLPQKKGDTALEPLWYTQEVPLGVRLKLNAQVVSEIARQLSWAVAQTETRLNEYSLRSAKRETETPTELLILLLTQWAKQNGLPVSPITTKEGGYDPAAFSFFMIELIQIFPIEYQDRKHKTPEAMAAKITRTRAKLSVTESV